MKIFPPRVMTLTTPAASDPLTLAEAKLFLRVDGSEEDSLVSDLIVAATQSAENYLRQSLITQSWTLEQQYAPGVSVSLPLGPVQTVSQVSIVLEDVTTVLASDTYELTADKRALALTQAATADRIVVEYVAGYGDASAVPGAIKQGILQQLSYLFHHREQGEAYAAQAVQLWQPMREVGI